MSFITEQMKMIQSLKKEWQHSGQWDQHHVQKFVIKIIQEQSQWNVQKTIVKTMQEIMMIMPNKKKRKNVY